VNLTGIDALDRLVDIENASLAITAVDFPFRA